MSFVLTERFNQDVLEEHFGKHRSIGHRNDNTDLYNFDYNSNNICIQREDHEKKRRVSWVSVENAPLPK